MGETNKEPVKMSFKDAPIGARFRYPNRSEVWVKNNSYPKGLSHDGRGLIARWNGNTKQHQEICCFSEKINDFETIIELI